MAKLFREHLDKDYSKEDYVKQFTIRIPESIAKLDRIEGIYKERILDAPAVVYETFAKTRKRLEDARKRLGDYISPFDL